MNKNFPGSSNSNNNNNNTNNPVAPNALPSTVINQNNNNNANAGSTTRRRSAGGNSNANAGNNANTAAGNNMTAVDRALSIGKTSQQILIERDQLFGTTTPGLPGAGGANNNKVRAAKLNEMLEGNILDRLDNALGVQKR